MAPSPRSGSRRSCCLQCRPPGRGRGRHCSRHAPRRTRARPPCTPTCTSPTTSTQAGTRLPGRPVACMLWLALLVCSLPGGLPLAARGRTRARLTPRTTFDIVPKTLPKTLPRYGMVTGAVLSSSLSSLLGDACAPRPRTRRSVAVSTAIDVNKDAPLALDTARRGAVPTAPIDARADRARDAHRLLCDLRHRLACARAVLFLSSPSAVALGRRPHRPHAIAPPPAQNQRRAPWCVSPARDQVGYEGRGAAQPGDYGNVTATSGARVAFEWGFSSSAPFR